MEKLKTGKLFTAALIFPLLEQQSCFTPHSKYTRDECCGEQLPSNTILMRTKVMKKTNYSEASFTLHRTLDRYDRQCVTWLTRTWGKGGTPSTRGRKATENERSVTQRREGWKTTNGCICNKEMRKTGREERQQRALRVLGKYLWKLRNEDAVSHTHTHAPQFWKKLITPKHITRCHRSAETSSPFITASIFFLFLCPKKAFSSSDTSPIFFQEMYRWYEV